MSARPDQFRPVETAEAFTVDAAFRPHQGRVDVVVLGDFDGASSDIYLSAVEAALASGLRVIVRFDGVRVFGSAAIQAIVATLRIADAAGADLSIGGLPSHAVRVLQAVDVADERLLAAPSSLGELPPSVFDAVVARVVMQGRESVCVTTADVDDPRIVFVNEAFTRLTGFSASEVLGANPRLLQGPLTDRTVIEELKRAVRARQEFTGEAVNYRRDGRPFWMNWRILDVTYGAGEFLLALQRDNTTLRQLSRLQAARARLASVSRSEDVPALLSALASAVDFLIEAPEAEVRVVLAADGKPLLTAGDPGSVTTARLRGRQVVTYESNDSVSVQAPVRLAGDNVLHVLIDRMHPDRLALVSLDHLGDLSRDAGSWALAGV